MSKEPPFTVGIEEEYLLVDLKTRDLDNDPPHSLVEECHQLGGGQVTPGFVGHSKYNVTQRKFIVGDGGIARLVWLPKSFKEEIRERLIKRGEELGIPDFIDRIADETVGVTEDEILPFLTEKNHPALGMDPIIG